jgi:hypothetical protein
MRLLRFPGFFFFAIALGVAAWLVPHAEGSAQPAHRVTCPESSLPLLVRAEPGSDGDAPKALWLCEKVCTTLTQLQRELAASDRLRPQPFAVADCESLYKRPPPSHS